MKRRPEKLGLTSLAAFLLLATHAAAQESQNAKNPQSALPTVDVATRQMTRVTCFSQVYELLLSRNSALRSSSATLASLQSDVQQASVHPNPTIGIDAENLAADRSQNANEYTASISQRVELGGKRRSRIDHAKAGVAVYDIQRRIALKDLIGQSRIAYAAVLFAKSRLSLVEQELAILKRTVRLISAKSSYGGALTLEVKRAELALESAQLKHAQNSQALQDTELRLVALWEGSRSDLDLSKGSLTLDATEKELETFDVTRSPQYLLQQAYVGLEQAQLQLTKSMSVPDVTISAGYRRLQGNSGDNAFIAGISAPLQIFDRKQFAIPGSIKRVEAEKHRLMTTKVQLNTELHSLQSQLRLLLNENELLETSLVPVSKRVLSDATHAYKLGQASYLDYVDSQRGHIAHKDRLIQVQFEAIKYQIAIQQLKGTVVSRIQNTPQGKCHDM